MLKRFLKDIATREIKDQHSALIVAVSMLALVVATFTDTRLSENPLSRFITVERAIDAETLSHDDSPLGSSIDSVMIDGRIYSSKPPSYTFLMIAEAWPINAMLGLSVSEYHSLYVWYLIVLNQVIPYGIMLIFALMWLSRETPHIWTRGAMLASLSIGCLPFGFAATLNNHTPTAVMLTLAFFLLDRIRGGRGGRREAIGVGVLTGMAASFEISAGIFVLIFIGLIAVRARQHLIAAIIAALIPFTLMFIGYDVVSGSPIPIYMRKELYDFPGSYWRNPVKNDALNDPKWLYLFHATFGHHGFISHSPLLVLGIWGVVRQLRDRGGKRFFEVLSISAGCLLIYSLVIFTTKNYGGGALSLRWFAQFMPLLTLMSLPILEKLRQRRLGRLSFYTLLLVSSLVVFEAWKHSAYQDGGWVRMLMEHL